MRHQQDELMNLQSHLKRLQGLQAQLEQQLSVPWSCWELGKPQNFSASKDMILSYINGSSSTGYEKIIG